jgi:hypothetical protein
VVTRSTTTIGAEPAASTLPSTAVAGSRLRMEPLDLALSGAGALLHLFAYQTIYPLLAISLFFAAGHGVMLWPRVGGYYERRIFSRVFAVGLVMAGVAAVFANYWADAGQLYSDAGSFFDIASGQAAGLNLDDLKVIHEGALAIVLWSAVYDLFAALGFPRARFIGVLVNVTAVAVSGVVALKVARQLYGEDPYRFERLTLLFAGCGLFWLFAGIHIRDAVVLLAVSLVVYTWLHFLARPDLGLRLLQLVGASLVAGAFFGFLRAQFVFVPIAQVLVLVGLTIAAGLVATFGGDIRLVLSAGQGAYRELALEEQGASSLGMSLILDQPAPIRLILGSVYLFVFPIPFWTGFQLESAYHLFKSFNVLFFYFFLPVLGLSVWHLWKHAEQRTPALLFIFFLSVGFSLVVAGTSAETRHLGAFLSPIFVLALLPDLRDPRVKHAYKQLLALMLMGVVLVHGLWLALKLG